MNDIVSLSSASGAAPGSQIHLENSRATGGSGSAAAGSGPSSATQQDSISLSAATSLLQQASNAGAADRASRVQQLKQQIEAGQYVADPSTVSSAIIDAGLAGE